MTASRPEQSGTTMAATGIGDGPLDVALVVVGAGLEGRRFPLRPGRLRVGRTPDNDIVVGHATVSAHHATLDVSFGGGAPTATVTDLDSTNGTLVDGFRVGGPTAVTSGNTLTFGAVECVFDVRTTASPEVWEQAAALVPPPGRNRRTVLIAHDPADRAFADVIAGYLQRAGHLVWIDRSGDGDGWKGRLFDTVWSCDAAVFVVSAAAAGSERVRREVHLAADQRTPVIPALIGTTELPDDLAFYLSARPAVDMRADPVAGMGALGARVGGLRRKHLARPWRTLRRVCLAVVLLAVALFVYRIVF